MSGYTRPKSPIQIAQENIARLTNETNRLRTMNSNLQRSIGQESINSQNRIRAIQNNMEQRNRSLSGAISGLRSNLKNSEQRYNDALSKQSKVFYDRQIAHRNEFNKKLKAQASWTSDQINNERQARIKAINNERRERVRALEQQKQWTEREIAKERARTDRAIANERNERIKGLQRERDLTNRQIEALDEEINARIDAERLLTDAKIDNLKTFTEARLTEQRAEYHRISQEKQVQIDAIRKDVDSIFQQTEDQQSTAKDYLEDLQKIVQEINEKLPHQKFTPGALNKISNKVNQAGIHINSAPQAAIANAQEAYFDLVELREEILEKEAEFNMWQVNVQETLRALNQIINENRKVELDGVSQEANHWTFGKYNEFQEKAQKVLKEVETNENLSVEDLKSIHESVEGLRKEHEGLIKEALNQIMSSQIRFEIADSTAAALANEDYEVVDGGYEGENGEPDPRKAFITKLSNGVHEIIVVVNPESPTSNSLILNSQDSTYKNPDVALDRMQEVARLIKEEKGIDVSTPECMDVNHRVDDLYGPAFDEVYKKGIPRKIRAQLGLNNPTEQNS